MNLVATAREMKGREGDVVVMGFLFFHFFMIWGVLDFGVLGLGLCLRPLAFGLEPLASDLRPLALGLRP